MQMSFYNTLYLLPQHLQEMKSPIVGVFFHKQLVYRCCLPHNTSHCFLQGWDAEDESGEATCCCGQVHDDLPQPWPWERGESRQVGQGQVPTLHCLGLCWARHWRTRSLLWARKAFYGTQRLWGHPCDITVHSCQLFLLHEIFLGLTGWCSLETSKITLTGMTYAWFQRLSQRIFLPIGDCAENSTMLCFASKFTAIGKELKTPLLCMSVKIFLLFVLRMKLLRQVSRTWKTDGLNSCSYKLLSMEHNPLYINITVDFSVQPKVS